ncbi:MAG: hypothetical protein OEW05_09150 [Candidatus Aminicenantes bacterium]|nr:hypothetical protein [Candidatus Aminicenantes bacterium]
MEVREHFYADDPRRGPRDVITRLAAVEYFFLGNGLLQAAVQTTRDRRATSPGLLIMHPDRLGPKRRALTLDPVLGLRPTLAAIAIGRALFRPAAKSLQVRWAERDGVPAVEAEWPAGPARVRECLLCPDRTFPRLVREIAVRNVSARRISVRVRTGVGRRSVFETLSVAPGEAKTLCVEYRITGGPEAPAVAVRTVPRLSVSRAAAAYWRSTADLRTGDLQLDHFYRAALTQLHAAVSKRGTIDGGLWQYNLEWVRDQAFIAMALTMTGQTVRAKTVLGRLLRRFIGPQGAPADSSRQRALEDCEPDQNGILLFALQNFLDWTGDGNFVLEHWEKIVLTADFLLRPTLRHEPSGLLHNRREFWERHSVHGIRDGFELAHQLFAVLGLRSAAALARSMGRRGKEKVWSEAAARIENAMLSSSRFALVERGRFIKRRAADGRVQNEVRPAPASGLPPATPLFTAGRHFLNPDSSAALPIAWELVDPRGRLAIRTLRDLERLWNQRWRGGGYGRYHISSEPDSPGPWPFASLFIARAAVEAGDGRKARRVLDWLGRTPGARAGTWFEFYGPRPVPPYPQVGITPWTWAETIFLFVHHVLGLRPGPDRVRLRPRFLPGQRRLEASFRVRGTTIRISLERIGAAERPAVRIDGVPAAMKGGAVSFRLPRGGRTIVVEGRVP